MKDRRLFYRVMLKIMTLAAVVFLLLVLVNSLFTGTRERSTQTTIETAGLEIGSMSPGEIRRVYWKGREVGILKRKFGDLSADQTNDPRPTDHPVLNQTTRSRLPDYFVFLNTGDSGNCPLFHDQKGFRDTCTGRRYDTNGREQGKSQNGGLLSIPPHVFKWVNDKPQTLIVGKWD